MRDRTSGFFLTDWPESSPWRDKRRNATSSVVHSLSTCCGTHEKIKQENLLLKYPYKMLDPAEIVDRYNCSQCSHQTASVFQLDHHVRSKHRNVCTSQLFRSTVEPEQIRCRYNFCDYESYNQLALYEHCKQAHNPRTEDKEDVWFYKQIVGYSCDHCMYRANSSLCLAKHHNLCKASVALRYSAENANDVESLDIAREADVKGVGAMESNWSTRNNSKSEQTHRFQCNLCSYRAKTRSTLKAHMLVHAKYEDIKWFQCSVCRYRAKTKWTLKSHMLIHAKIEEIDWSQCSLCTYRCKQKPQLKRHMLKHAKDEEIDWFRCNQCSYRAKQKVTLKKHIIVRHAKDEEIDWFECNHCAYRTNLKSNLKRHVIICGKKVIVPPQKQNSQLDKDMQKHAKNEENDWFRCNHCSFRAKLEWNLKRHMLKHAINEEIDKSHSNHCTFRAKLKNNLQTLLSRHAAN